MSNILTDVEAGLGGLVGELRARADEIEQRHAPVIHDAAEILERMSQSKITAELMQLAEGKVQLDGLPRPHGARPARRRTASVKAARSSVAAT